MSMKCDLKICGFGLARAPLETHAVSEYVAATSKMVPCTWASVELFYLYLSYRNVVCGLYFLGTGTGTLLFAGKDLVHQLHLIMEVIKFWSQNLSNIPTLLVRHWIFHFVFAVEIGSPTEEDIGSLNESAKQYLRQLPCLDPQSFLVKFLNVPHLAIDLMEKMLKFDPRRRITGSVSL